MFNTGYQLYPVYSIRYQGLSRPVLRRLSLREVFEMKYGLSGVSSIDPHLHVSHYYSDCAGLDDEQNGLTWSLQDTTCPQCLQTRANQLAGWRWDHATNADDVGYLKVHGYYPKCPFNQRCQICSQLCEATRK